MSPCHHSCQRRWKGRERETSLKERQPGLAIWPRVSRCPPWSGGLGWHGGQYSPLPDVGVHRLGEDRGRGLGDNGVGIEPFYLQEEVCTVGTPKQGH